MVVHHLNCMSFHFGARSITHCLLLESSQGLILVDTGLGSHDYANPTPKMRAFMKLNQVPPNPEQTAVSQVAGLGYDPEEVKHIVLTHLHLDHCGGLPDFPWAEVHAHSAEYDAANRPRGLISRFGYEAGHWAHGPRWVLHELRRESWFGLPSTTVIEDSITKVMLVALPGHSPGHCAVAVEINDMLWLLHCGDAYVRASQIDPQHPSSPFPSWAGRFERALFPEGSLESLRTLLKDHRSRVIPFASHESIAFAQMARSS